MIRLAIVGANAAGQYAQVAWRFSDLAFVAIAGSGPDIDANAERLGAGIVCDDFDELLRQHGAEFDAVLIHGDPVHGDVAEREAHGRAAAEAAKHVLVEVPWTTSSSSIEQFCEAHERIGMRNDVEDAGLFVSMVTADFDVPLNNQQGPNSLREIGPSLDVAEDFGCDLIRICMKSTLSV